MYIGRSCSSTKGKDLLALSREVWRSGDGVEPVKKADAEAGGRRPRSTPSLTSPEDRPLNLILYGPPTGKTYETAELAVRICDGVVPGSREALMFALPGAAKSHGESASSRFTRRSAYEEFVEGIRPSTEGGAVRYDVRPGVFKQAGTRTPASCTSGSGNAATSVDLERAEALQDVARRLHARRRTWIYATASSTTTSATVRLRRRLRGLRFTAGGAGAASRAKPRRKDTDYPIAAAHYIKNELRQGDSSSSPTATPVSGLSARWSAPTSTSRARRDDPHSAAGPVALVLRREPPVDTVFEKRLSQMSILRHGPGRGEMGGPRGARHRSEAGLRRAGPNCVLVIDEINRANLRRPSAS